MVLSDFFPHPLPESFNRVEVGTVSWERHQLKAEFFGPFMESNGSMPGRTIPDNQDGLLRLTKPFSNSLQKHNGVIGVAIAFCFCQAKSASIDNEKARHFDERVKRVMLEKRVN